MLNGQMHCDASSFFSGAVDLDGTAMLVDGPFHQTEPQAGEKDGGSDTRLNFGGFYNFSDTYHLLFSAGHMIQGPSTFQGYLAFQITLGPQKQSERAQN